MNEPWGCNTYKDDYFLHETVSAIDNVLFQGTLAHRLQRDSHHSDAT